MALKIAGWLIGVGCFFAFAGLCFLPAAFGLHPDSSMLSGGAMVFCMGMVLIASGLYAKARYWTEAAATNGSNGSKRGRKINCDSCGKHDAIIQCRVHQLQLCADCVSEHYDFRSCAYVPSVRQGNNKAKAYSQGSGS